MKADYVLSYDVLTRAKEQELYLMARIKGHSTPESKKRRPLNVSVVLDRSGSMSGDKIEYVKQATSFLVNHLTGRDMFSLVSYDNVVEVEVEPTAPVHKDGIHRIIKKLHARNSTNLSGGWLKGTQLVEQERVETGVNRVLLLTDGLANVGISDPVRLGAMARQKRNEGVTTTTIGVGLGFNEDLLTTMASEGGGAFYFIDNPDQAPSIFQEEINDLLSVVGQNLTITLTPTADVKLIRQWNTYPMSTKGEGVAFTMGDLFSDEEKLLLLQLGIPGLKELGEVVVGKLRFEYDELKEDSVEHHVIEVDVKVNVVAGDEPALTAGPKEEVMREVLLLKAARARDDAIKRADKRDYKSASETLRSVARAIKDSGIEDDELQSEHDMLLEESVNLEFGEQRYDSHTRKQYVTESMMSDRSAHYSDMKFSTHQRMKASRNAIERSGDTPKLMHWNAGEQSLEDIKTLTIGRDEANDIVIDDDMVSAKHCKIERFGDDLVLTDIGSSNGTFANSGTVDAPFRLSEGDVVTIGKTLFTFE